MKKTLFLTLFLFTIFFVKDAKASFYDDDFDDYSVGSSTTALGRWVDRGVYTIPTITNSGCYSDKCVNLNKTSGTAYEFTGSSTELVSYGFFRFFQQYANSAGSDLIFYFDSPSSVNLARFRFRYNTASSTYYFEDLAGTKIYDNQSVNVWHTFNWEYSKATNKLRIKLDSEAWTSWYTLASDINKIRFYGQNVSVNGTRLIDTFLQSENTISVNTINFNTLQVGTSTELTLNGSSLQDFDYWQFLWTGASTGLYTVSVQYGNAPSTYLYIDSDNFQNILGSDMEAQFLKGHDLPNGDWYAIANLWDEQGNLVAQSSEIAFFIDSTSENSVNQDGLPNNSGAYADITSTSTTAMSTVLNTTVNVFSNIFPFNIGTNMYDSWIDSETQTIPSELAFLDVTDANGNISLDIGPITSAGTTSNMTLFGPAIFEDTQSLTDFFANIRILSKYMMWAFFIFSLRRRGVEYYNILTNK